MRYSILLLGIILLSPLVYAETSFFDNPDDAFTMGSSGQSLGQNSIGVSSGSSNYRDGSSKKEPSNDTSGSNGEKAPMQDVYSGNKTKETNNIKSEILDHSPKEISTRGRNYLLFLAIFALFFSVCFGIFKYKNKIKHSIKNDLKRIIDNNTIKGLIDKEVYTDMGDYIGSIKEIILERNNIYGLKIELDKKHKFSIKGCICKYAYVKAVGQIVIIDSRIIETLKIKYT